MCDFPSELHELGSVATCFTPNGEKLTVPLQCNMFQAKLFDY